MPEPTVTVRMKEGDARFDSAFAERRAFPRPDGVLAIRASRERSMPIFIAIVSRRFLAEAR
jgi:hypothetical protein